MRPEALTFSLRSDVLTTTLRKRNSLSLPLICVCRFSGIENLLSTGAKVRAISFSSTLPLIGEVEKASGRRSFLLGSWKSALAIASEVWGSLMETSLRCAVRLLALTFNNNSLIRSPEPRSSAIPLVICATKVSLPNESIWISNLARTSKCPTSKAPRWGLPTFLRGW